MPESVQATVAEPRGDDLVRRFAAILALDIVGYTRLMERDETATHLAMKAHRRDLVDGIVEAQQGRIVKYTGDGFLAEFQSALEAVSAAIAIQRGMAERNAAIEPERRMVFRSGVNVGTIIVEPEDIYGDGVNVAARLQTLSEPGGVCVSEAVREQVRLNLAAPFADLGEHSVKNIARPLRAYGLSPDALAALPAATAPAAARAPRAFAPREDRQRLSIAVLPFDNRSGDAEQDYFADGMSEDIITALSHFRNLVVMSRNSSFVYKGRAVDVRAVGRDLGVRYVVEGSVRRAGGQLRITAELIDAASGAHLWAEYFDGAVGDVFGLQDRVTQRIVTLVEPRVRAAEIDRARRKPAESLDAYDYYLRALALRTTPTLDGAYAAIALLEKSIAMDPHYGPALALAAGLYNGVRDRGLAALPPDRIALAVDYAARALRASPDDPDVLCRAGHALACLSGDYAGGLATIDRARELNPSMADAWGRSAMVRVYAGDYDIALDHAAHARDLNPDDVGAILADCAAGHARLFRGDFDEAQALARQALAGTQKWETAFRLAVAAAAAAGRDDEARAAAGALLQSFPAFTISNWRARTPFTNLRQLSMMNEAFARAGLPE